MEVKFDIVYGHNGSVQNSTDLIQFNCFTHEQYPPQADTLFGLITYQISKSSIEECKSFIPKEEMELGISHGIEEEMFGRMETRAAFCTTHGEDQTSQLIRGNCPQDIY
jgi:hypothetical protein